MQLLRLSVPSSWWVNYNGPATTNRLQVQQQLLGRLRSLAQLQSRGNRLKCRKQNTNAMHYLNFWVRLSLTWICQNFENEILKSFIPNFLMLAEITFPSKRQATYKTSISFKKIIHCGILSIYELLLVRFCPFVIFKGIFLDLSFKFSF